jgi:site-specific DNA-methyltransferase (adenine-specific)
VDASTCLDCGARRVDQQLGLEPTPDEYITRMVAVFREVRRVLRADGTLWLNIGDSYASSPPGNVAGVGATSVLHGANDASGVYRETSKAGHATKRNTVVSGLKPKDLVGIPWKLAFALQADGWYLRSDIIWAKPNPMPESVADRPTKAHEYVFLLSKSPRYFFDAEAVREPYQDGDPRPPHGPGQATKGGRAASGTRNRTTARDPGRAADGAGATHEIANRMQNQTGLPGERMVGDSTQPGGPSTLWVGDGAGPEIRGPDGRLATRVVARDGSVQHRDGERWPNSGRNIRSVWVIATQPYPEAHFATFPEELVRRCVLAGTSERGCCSECGKPWEREVENEYVKSPAHGAGPIQGSRGATPSATHLDGGRANKTGVIGQPRVNKQVTTLGWRPACTHNQSTVPCTVLDPFIGSGTTAKVARELFRHTVGIELSKDYCDLIVRRTQQQGIPVGDWIDVS